ncbi:MAG: glycosyltransferase family 4 protein [Gammaproteobacteria bacterium]|nr:glycosyltransferase family 4 protein [Gammaproteobacteria bacterium]
MRSSANVLLLVENNGFPFDVRVRREAHALRDAGYQVTVISPRSSAQPWKEQVDGISVYRFPAPPAGNGVVGYAFEFGYATLVMLLLTAWVALRKGVDVIHAANPPDTLFVIGVIFKLFGKKFVFDHHDLSPETYLSRFNKPRPDLVYNTLRLLERCSFGVADVVVATNESYKRLALSRGGKRLDQVFIVRNGPPLSFQPIEHDPDLARRANHLIGYIGTMGPQDGVDYWLRAIREMVFTIGRRDFLAIIIGSGDALPTLQVLAKDLQIEPYVWFCGRISDIEARRYLSTVNVCVHPDPLSPLNDKSTMNKMMEYMALGKPTVAFDLVETRFSAQGAALYVRPNDELEFAKQVSWLLDDPTKCEQMGKIGRDRIANGLAWESSVPEFLRAYNHLGVRPRGQADRG